MTTSLCVTDLLNILLVDGAVPPAAADDDVPMAAEDAPQKGAAIDLPPAGKFLFWCCVVPCLLLPEGVSGIA